ncbi:MAG: type II toxin-antitoxin system PemK/MazF family toxin [Oscillospiraceae bacterium]|nr:type II toxin-antitoxin system PemK/MazF family toxin [Oscillospiraceae bacterium]
MNKTNLQQKSEYALKIEAMLKDENFPYRRGNIVWVHIPEEWKGSTHIQSGIRRGVIFSNDVNNLFSDLIYIIPCSRKNKPMKLHVKHHNQYILAEQIIPIDKSWILSDREIEKLDILTLKEVESNFMKQFGLKDMMAS